MALSSFDNKEISPNDQTLDEMLGESSGFWSSLKEQLQEKYGPLAEEWNFSGKAYGWSFRLKQAKRVLIYMTPCEGYFLASFALGERVCSVGRNTGLQPSVVELIDSAPKYAEGRGVRIPVKTKDDVDDVVKLAGAKAAN